MADNEPKLIKRPKQKPLSAKVTVVNRRGVEANPLRRDLDTWLAKGWSLKASAQAE